VMPIWRPMGLKCWASFCQVILTFFTRKLIFSLCSGG
jgi:hypothetical protein